MLSEHKFDINNCFAIILLDLKIYTSFVIIIFTMLFNATVDDFRYYNCRYF